MIFLITFVLAYSMTKGVVIVLIYFFIFLWDYFVLGLVLSGGDLIKTAKSYMRSICWKLKGHDNLSTTRQKVQSGLTIISRLVPVARSSHQNAQFSRNVTFRISSSLILYIPSLPTEMVRSLLREKP